MQDILLKTIINDDAKLLLEITEKQPLAMSKFLFSGRPVTTLSRQPGRYLDFPKSGLSETIASFYGNLTTPEVIVLN